MCHRQCPIMGQPIVNDGSRFIVSGTFDKRVDERERLPKEKTNEKRVTHRTPSLRIKN